MTTTHNDITVGDQLKRAIHNVLRIAIGNLATGDIDGYKEHLDRANELSKLLDPGLHT